MPSSTQDRFPFLSMMLGMELRLKMMQNLSIVRTRRKSSCSRKTYSGYRNFCDETAAALIDEAGTIVADVVDWVFHSRFGGVVPEIASRKHIEAIGGVVQECLHQARLRTGQENLNWCDLAAVSVTYAPGLVGALVVGLAFAKGLAWAADKPLSASTI